MSARSVVVVVLALFAGLLALLVILGSGVLGLSAVEQLATAALLLAIGLVVAAT